MPPDVNYDHKSRRKRQSIYKRAKLREAPGVAEVKKSLRFALLNVDGLGPGTFHDVVDTVNKKQPDLCILLETKRRFEDLSRDITIDGYDLTEITRSNVANDRAGGGLAFYTKRGDGLIFEPHCPDIPDASHSFVAKERYWVTVKTAESKTAVCGLYLGCQYQDNRFSSWNDMIYLVVQIEAAILRAQGYRIVFMGDFNAHVGCKIGQGVVGNKPGINENGQKFINFLEVTDSCHVNGLCRTAGQWETRVTKGLWTRQRGGVSTILDYAGISREHASSVVRMEIDDCGLFGGGSDHNWLFIDLSVYFVKKKRLHHRQFKKPRWNIRDDQDWSAYKRSVLSNIKQIKTDSVESLNTSLSGVLLQSMADEVGLTTPSKIPSSPTLPRSLVDQLELKRSLESEWKTIQTTVSNLPVVDDASAVAVSLAETKFLDQKKKVSELLFVHDRARRNNVLKDCKGGTSRARRNFWSYVSPHVKKSSDITAAFDPSSGVLKCNAEEIKLIAEDHLKTIFHGSFDKVPVNPTENTSEHQYAAVPPTGNPADHTYSVDPCPTLPHRNDSCELEPDPAGWLNVRFNVKEVTKMVKLLKVGKATGWDNLPNEAIKNAPEEIFELITQLFNMVKDTGVKPCGWAHGRITLVHKRGLRERLGNYRPITVIVALSGLYSKVLNDRLITVVETHHLLGEVQNGFRKERGGHDNIFILDTILWKAKAFNQKVHMAFVDITKAYDSVNRRILWKRLSALGVNGSFLAALQTIYTDDNIVCEINGLTTKPVFLQRGLRQGCALSPMLFALYIADIGNDLNSSNLGFMIGGLCISGLLFADDIVLVARSALGLKELLKIVHAGCSNLKLLVSEEKSQVISPTPGVWKLFDEDDNTVLSLKQVLEYTYLGTPTFGTMYKTSVAKQKQCIITANKYKGSCIYVSKLGPDIVDVALCTWANIAIPAVLYGCEMVLFTEDTIETIEKIQNQVAKFILGVSVSTANVCAQSELGLKTFRQLVYEKQLKFFLRVLALPQSRWVCAALMEHLSGDWVSPYYSYICKIRCSLKMFDVPASMMILQSQISDWFLDSTNDKIISLSLPSIRPIVSLTRLQYVCESDYSSVISEFKFSNAGLGNREPRLGYHRMTVCPLCPQQFPNTEFHLVMQCSSVANLRSTTKIISFINNCKLKGLSSKVTYDLFINGFDSDKTQITVGCYIERGRCLHDLREFWLSKW